jgi:ABC-2 type transport system ATP-binding protein
MAEQSNIVDMQQVTLKFKENVGVFDLDIHVPRGTILGLIGPSGSGKTTAVRLMLGLYKADQGTIRVLGEDPTHFRNRTREKIGYMPQHFTLYPNLTVMENVKFVSSLYGMNLLTRGRRLREVVDFVELSDARGRLASQLSGGMKRRLALAGAIAHNPDLLFADEPTAGIDPVLRGKFWEGFRTLRDQGHTLVTTTQYVGEAAYCDYVGVLRDGRVLMIDTPEMLRKRALGGEIVALVVEPDNVLPATQALIHHPMVTSVYHRPTHGKPGLLHIYVEEASDALPALFNMFRDEHPEIKIITAEEYMPPWDDIFVELMQQAEAESV